MEESNVLLWDLIELAGQLRQERLFIQSEQIHLQELNEKVLDASTKLAQVAWMTVQQRVNLNRMACHRRASSLQNSQFVDSHKVLGYQHSAPFGELLLTLRNSPQLVARILVAGDKLLPDEMHSIINSLVAGLYASCVLPQDENLVVKILSHLISLQLLPAEYPRRLLRQDSCAFSRLYSVFHEGLFSGKLFLTAALHAPIMQLLMLEERYLDVDPEKADLRLSEEEMVDRLDLTEESKLELEQNRSRTVRNLVSITKSFICSIKENLHCFPSSVCWLVGQIYVRLMKEGVLQEREVFAMCTDLIFTRFICQAIATPEPFGITDASISLIARSNLNEVAKILQILAMRKFQPVESKMSDFYSLFDRDAVSCIVDIMIEGSEVSDDPPVSDNLNLQGVNRSTALLTQSDLNSLITLLRSLVSERNSDDSEVQKELEDLLKQVPEQLVNGHHKSTSLELPSKKTSILSKVGKGRSVEVTYPEDEGLAGEKVLTFTLDTSVSFLGLEPEHKVLQVDKNTGPQPSNEAERSDRTEGQEKRTRFSLSHDDGSIGNTSDNLEVVSEAPSNHSVASSLELETEDQNDNLSDMISANVSGRGSPNISGRDTPSSQITEGDEGGQMVPRQTAEFNPPPPINKSYDIDEKFGKFEIKALIEVADETFSFVSDTWSTDVLASDCELVDKIPQSRTLLPLQEPPQPEISETASEAWSTDVVASDSERLTEVDTDDTASVARSDDTGRSEVESRGDPETFDDPTPPAALPPNSFQVIREEGRNPPPRSEETSVVRVTPKPDQRRKNYDLVDANRNKLKVGDKSPEMRSVSTISIDGGSPMRLSSSQDSQSSFVSCSSQTSQIQISTFQSRPHYKNVSLQTSQDISGEEGGDREGATGGISTASIASSTSSGSASDNMQNGSAQNEMPLGKPAGAIPKSISFDKTAERGDKESLEEDRHHKKSFFRNFKLPFKNRRGKIFRGHENDLENSLRLKRNHSEEARSTKQDTSDDILAKYRRKPSSNHEQEDKSRSGIRREVAKPAEPDRLLESYPFDDAKKKLRLVLSTAEIQQVQDVLPAMRQAWMRKGNELVAFLQLQLAEAIHLQDRNKVPHLHETIRCIKMLSNQECHNLFQSLKEDYKNRAPYISYLVRCRQSLLSTLAYMDRLLERLKSDRMLILKFLTSKNVTMFLNRKDGQLSDFMKEFQHLSLADEKSDLLDSFLQTLCGDLEKDPMWQSANEKQLLEARVAIERIVISKVYIAAMYPNGDGDIHRDQMLQDHISKLAKVVTPNHKDLRIPKMFHHECPWLSAQAEISQMAAYRTPRDKLQCVLRCTTTIMNLLSLACVPAADDLMPVLVYVLIMANPPSLLSTLEYVTSFYGNRLEGEEQYYWIQFCSAIEFIKTMDYVVSD